IREKFGSRFVFSDTKENTDFLAKALESGWFEMAYEDDEAYILKIRDEKGEPPNPSASDDDNGASDEPTEEEIKQSEDEEKNANAADTSAEEEEK
ncbi:MAG TPA: hypothetical protein VGB00_18885, partial [Pyrinomonadaceae bacterium]